MELYIRIKDGVPFEHPMVSDNFRQAFPDIDVDNLPSEFAKFVRVQPPPLGPYEKNQTVTYELIDGVYTDVYHSEQMTPEEILEIQNATKAKWMTHGFASWIFDELTCSFMPPVPKPQDGKQYRWDEPTISWVEVPA